MTKYLAAGAVALLVIACSDGRPVEAPPPNLAPTAPATPYDIVITGGTVIDGTGATPTNADIAIRGDRIAWVGPSGALRSTPTRDRIDASGLYVSPGFIDVLSLSGSAILEGRGTVPNKIFQGITSEIFGESTSGGPTPMGSGRSFAGGRGFSHWLEAMRARGSSTNFGSFLGGSTLRLYAMGMRPGPPSPAELDTMRVVVRRAMEDGAMGLATALIYPPGAYATTDELVEAAREVGLRGGIYITHLRSEGDRFLEGLREAIDIGQRASVPVEVYHIKAAGRSNWSKAAEAIRLIDSVRAAGVPVTANTFPYLVSATGLTACLPPWVSANGRRYRNLADSAVRSRLIIDMTTGDLGWENFCALATPAGVRPVSLGRNWRLRGMSLAERSRERATPWPISVMDLILEEGHRVTSHYELRSAENLRLFVRQPWVRFGTDAGGVDPGTARGLIHPRAYGTFARGLGRFVRDEGIISLEDFVRRNTWSAAQLLGIENRGRIKTADFADVIIFDLAAVSDSATFEAPHRLATGMELVIVNGEIVLRAGEHTGARPGRILRGPGYTPQPET